MNKITHGNEVAFNNYGATSYHIDTRNDCGIIFQRHVWKLENGEVETEEWIKTK
jgi:hypothetical protein